MRYSRPVTKSGFSLLELMAVILIIGLVLGIAGLSLTKNDGQEGLWDMLEKFMEYSEFASDRAVLSGKTIGLKLEPPIWQYEQDKNRTLDEIGWRYSWLISTPVGWQPVPKVEPTELPPTIDLAIEVDGLEWDYEEQLDKTTPVAAFYSSGDVTDIQIEISDKRFPGYTEVVKVNEYGRLVVESLDEARKEAEQEEKKRKK